MQEYSRILIEQYCRDHNSAKSRRLEKPVRKSYDMNVEYTDDDGIFVEKAIAQEKDERLQEALQDLEDFMFGYQKDCLSEKSQEVHKKASKRNLADDTLWLGLYKL